MVESMRIKNNNLERFSKNLYIDYPFKLILWEHILSSLTNTAAI